LLTNEPYRGAQVPDMVPILIAQGYTAIAVIFDVWGLSGLLDDSLKKGRALVEQSIAEAAAKTNGNGAAAAEETVETEVVNGKGKP